MNIEHEFFLVCTPGFEDISEAELGSWFPGLASQRERGGLLVKSSLATGFALNRFLKTPTRVLLRLARFGCRDFPKLHKKISGLPWEEWLDDRSRVTFHASSSGSRLKIKSRIEETCWEAKVYRLRKRGRPHARFEGPPADAYIRFEDDVCTLSLDTSGEILHKRGVRVMTAEAPVRETTAAALLYAMRTCALVSGRPITGIELVDAMCGSGTFLLEAKGLYSEVRSRRFAFQDFKAVVETETATAPAGSFIRFLGFDRDAEAIEIARKNLAGVFGESQEYELRCGDFFEAAPLHDSVSGVSLRPRWLVANPPYDERLPVAGGRRAFYEKLMTKAEDVVRPDVAGFLFPEEAQPESLRPPANWERVSVRRFSNGGIGVMAVIYSRRP